MATKKLAILGSTGSIGTQTLDVVRQHPDLFSIELLTANSNVELLAAQAREFDANAVIICNESKYGDLRTALEGTDVKVFAGMQSVCDSVVLDNIDIVVNELDALKNIDFNTREIKSEFTQLTLVRIGTCGGLQPHTPVGTYVVSKKSIGFDGLLNYYDGRNEVCDLECERKFVEHMDWSPLKGAPYIIDNDAELLEQIAGDDMVRGYTIACGGFYGPQGRQLRLKIQDPQQNEKVETFEYDGTKICNFEMESSALAGLSALLGHKAITCCMVIANRWAKEMNTEYKNSIEDLIQKVLDRI